MKRPRPRPRRGSLHTGFIAIPHAHVPPVVSAYNDHSFRAARKMRMAREEFSSWEFGAKSANQCPTERRKERKHLLSTTLHAHKIPSCGLKKAECRALEKSWY